MIAGHKFDCPSCGGSLEVRAAGYTTTVACRYCGSVIDVANPDAKLIAQYHEAVADLAIPLDTRGTLEGVEWEAIGWQARQDSSGTAWEEYLLFNPYAGYRWLVCVDGEWTFGRALVERPELVSAEVVRWQGKSWEIDDAPDTYTTTRVVGEFYWRVKVGEAVTGATFWSGQHQLSFERNQDEENWTLLDPVGADDIGKAFKLGGGGPSGSAGSASAEGGPSGSPPRRRALVRFFARSDDAIMVPMKMMLMAIISCGVLTLALIALTGSEGTSQKHIDVAIGAPETTTSLGTITVRHAHALIEIESNGRSSALLDSYVDLDYRLVDHATQQAVTASTSIEDYSGSDSEDHPWRTTTTIAGMPRGTYDLLVEAAGHKSGASATGAPSTPAPSVATNPWAIDNGDKVGIDIGVEVGAFPVALVVLAVVLLTLPVFVGGGWAMMRDRS